MANYKAIIRSKDSGSTNSLLKKGLVPGIIYGRGTESTKVAFEDKILKRLMSDGGFYSKILDIDIDGKNEKVLPKTLQYHPSTDQLIHFDFLRVQENTKVTVEVIIEFLNQDICPGIKKGGVLNLVRRFVELTCDANKIPEKLIFDLEKSEIGDAVKISNIELPDGVKPTITDRDFVIATLVPPTVEVEETKPTEEGEEGESEAKEDEKTPDKDKKDEKPEEKKEASKENDTKKE
tara:strand:- start:840 stop:1544 length:705 start_codon:yes stop_codon:yes gene_type:complete